MKTLYLLFFTLVYQQAIGQAQISGKVTDEKGEPIAGANVYIKDTYDGTSTAADGKFNFTSDEPGIRMLVVSFLGYEEFQQEVNAAEGKANLHIKLKESINRLNAVVITAGSFTAGEEASREVLKPLDIVTTAGATADIAGALNTLPGTQKVGEAGRLFVRGGGGNETKTFIDGNQVLHAYSSTAPNTPGRGRFSPFMFSGTSFSTGGYSAEYGQALSSALVLKSKDNPEQTRTDLSLMSVGGGLTHTQKVDRGALIIGMDYTNLTPYFELVKQRIDYKKAPAALQGNVIFRKQLENDDVIKFYTNASTTSFNISQPQIGSSMSDQVGLQNDYYYVNSTYRKIINDKWSMNTGISYTSFSEDVAFNEDAFYEKEKGAHVKIVAAHEMSEKVSMIIGTEYFNRSYDFTYEEESSGNLGFNEDLATLFVEADFYTSNKFVTRAGVRSEYNALQDRYYISPRLSLAYKVDRNSQISLAYGHFNQTGENKLVRMKHDLEDEKARHYIVNYQRELEGRTFRVEGYYKQYTDLVKFDAGNQYNPIAYNNSGEGFAKGFDIFWRDNKTVRGLDYWISYSFLDTERDYLDYPQSAVPLFASAHNFSAVGKYFIQSIQTQVGATYSFSSPRPYHDPNSPGFNNKTTKPYHDLSANLSHLLSSSIIIHASVTNILGIKNVFGYESSTTPDVEGNYILRPITPTAPRFIFLGVFITLSKEKTLNQLPNL